MNKIPIVMATDDNYAFQTGVAISSIIKNKKKDTEYEFFILENGKLADQSKEKIQNTFGRDVDIHFLYVDEKKFREAYTAIYISVATYYRFLIMDLLPQYDKCIYLDVDLLVLFDLNAVYELNIEDYYLASVLDCGIQYYNEKYKSYLLEMDISSDKEYFNAGFLVMNLKKMRQDNLKNKLMEYVGHPFKMMDQDILNKCCRGYVKYLPLKYNLFAGYYQHEYCLKNKAYSEQEIREAQESPAIIHYASSYKPWINVAYDKNGIWWEYARKFQNDENTDDLYNKAKLKQKECMWKNILEKCENDVPVIVFGFSDIGKKVIDTLQICGVGNIIGICDNDKQKLGNQYKNIEVYRIEELLKRIDQKFVIVITSQNYAKEIHEQLIDLGVDEDRICIYKEKGMPYYFKIDFNYYKEEVEELIIKKYGRSDKYIMNSSDVLNKLQDNVENFLAWM